MQCKDRRKLRTRQENVSAKLFFCCVGAEKRFSMGEIVLLHVAHTCRQRHPAELSPLIGALTAPLQIVVLPHAAVGFHLEGVQVIHRSLHLPDIADAHQRTPEILHIEKVPTVVGGLRLTHMNHLMVLQRIETAVEFVGILLRACEDMPEDGNARVSLPAPEAAHRGLHVAHAGRPRCTEDHQQ